MSEAYAGTATGRFAEKSYAVPAAAVPHVSASFPMWMKVCFVLGIILFTASALGLIATPLIGSSAAVPVLFATAALGLGALWIIAKVAPKYDAGR